MITYIMDEWINNFAIKMSANSEKCLVIIQSPRWWIQEIHYVTKSTNLNILNLQLYKTEWQQVLRLEKLQMENVWHFWKMTETIKYQKSCMFNLSIDW